MNNKDFVELVAQNPDLPIITLVHGEVCGDDCGYWLGHCGSASVELVGLIGERYYTDLEEHPEINYYVIIDDDCDMLPEQIDHFIMTNTHVGFTLTDFQKFEEIYMRDKGRGGSFQESKSKEYKGDTNNAEYV